MSARQERQTDSGEIRGSRNRLEEIRERESAALPGPWRWFGNVDSNVVHLATAHSGRMFILDPDIHITEYVYNHVTAEGYALDYVRENPVQWWCPAEHDEHYGVAGGRIGPPDEDDALEWEHLAPRCRCEAIAAFLHQAQDPLDPQELHLWATDDFQSPMLMTRGVQRHADLRFQDHDAHLMFSYRKLARFEVLGGKTMAEHLASGGRESDLYRQDIVGIDNPDAEFIAHSREDVTYLLAKIDYAARFLREHGGPSDCDCEGFTDPCVKCVANEALRSLTQ